MYQTGRSERCIYNVPISGALDSRLQVKQVSKYMTNGYVKYMTIPVWDIYN